MSDSTKSKQISPESLHISSFLLVKNGSKVLLLKAGPNHRLEFRRGKIILPGAVLAYGEDPKEGAKRVARDQLENSEGLEPKLLEMQSYLGNHWDLCFLYECEDKEGKNQSKA